MQETGKEEVDPNELFATIAREQNWNYVPANQQANTHGQRFLTGATPLQPSQNNQYFNYQTQYQSNTAFNDLGMAGGSFNTQFVDRSNPYYGQTFHPRYDMSSTSDFTASSRDAMIDNAAQASYTQPLPMQSHQPTHSQHTQHTQVQRLLKQNPPIQEYKISPSAPSTQSKLFNPEVINNPSSIPLKLMHSASGFDVVGALVKLATRDNPKIELGPIDLSCSFLVTDVRLPDMPIVYVSPTFEELTGYSVDEILGRNCRFLQHPTGEIFPGSTRSYTDHSVVQKMKQCTSELSEGQFTLVNYKKNGEPFLNHLTMIPISFGDTREITHYFGLQIDLILQPQAIIKRLNNGTYSVNYHYDGKRLENEDSSKDLPSFENNISETVKYAEIPRFMNSFDDICSDFIFVLSLRGLFLHLSSKTVKDILEYEGSEMIGHKIGEFVHPADLVSLMRDLRNCSNEGSVNFICRVKRKYSGYFYMEMNAHVYSGSKRNRCFIISAREQYVPNLPLSTVLIPEQLNENETWLKISPQGLILFATSTCQTFFGKDQSSLIIFSMFDFVSSTDNQKFSDALMHDTKSDLNLNLVIDGERRPVFARIYKIKDPLRYYCWVQLKRNAQMLQTFDYSENLFSKIESLNANSIVYESNKLKVENAKLLDEINKDF